MMEVVKRLKEAARWGPHVPNLVILRRYRLVFCPVPKVACSSWKRTIRRAMGFEDWEDTDPHDRRRNGLVYLNRASRSQRTALLVRPDYVRALFVRNPWTRVVSAFRSKLEGKTLDDIRETPSSFLAPIFEETHPGPLTLDDFLDYLEGRPPDRMNEHFQPQSHIAGLGRVRYDFIGRFEELLSDAERLVALCGLPSFYSGSVGRDATHTDRVASDYLDTDRIDRIRGIYQEDVELLGYEPPVS
jgi:hypothetical protein